MVMTYGELYRRVRDGIFSEQGENAAFAAREILSVLSGHSTAALMAKQAEPAEETVAAACLQAAERILAGEPLAYVLGVWSFYGMDLTVTPDVLIPRDDTMAVVDLAIAQRDRMPAAPRILDLCTGSGCIGLALARKISDAKITLADISEGALKIAKKNAVDLKFGGRTACIQADVRQRPDEFIGKFHMIVSNPPYITAEEMKQLDRSVRNYEPHLALYGGEDGLEFYRAILENYSHILLPGGFICFEFGMGQETGVCRLLEKYHYTVLKLQKDSGGIIRAVVAQKKERYDEYGNG